MGRTRRLIGSAAVVMLGLAVASCTQSTGSGGSASGSLGGTRPGPGQGWTDCPSGRCTWTDSGKTARSKGRSAGVVTGEAESVPAPAVQSTTTTVASSPRQAPTSATPYASSVDDNARWSEYLQYRQSFDASHPDAGVEHIP